MSARERFFCRSLPWRLFTRGVVLPWAIGGAEPSGDVLELGSGSGAMAVGLLERYPSIRLTATDVDPIMVDAARGDLARFGDRVEVREADAAKLPFEDGSFDAVVSFIMLHHVIEWESALGEIARVLRPGGRLAGYDLVSSRAGGLMHRSGSHNRFASAAALRTRLDELPFDSPRVQPAFGGSVARFSARRSSA